MFVAEGRLCARVPDIRRSAGGGQLSADSGRSCENNQTAQIDPSRIGFASSSFRRGGDPLLAVPAVALVRSFLPRVAARLAKWLQLLDNLVNRAFVQGSLTRWPNCRTSSPMVISHMRMSEPIWVVIAKRPSGVIAMLCV